MPIERCIALLLQAVVVTALLIAARPASGSNVLDFVAVYSDGVSYPWGYQNVSSGGTTTTNWIGPQDSDYPGLPGDIANITTATNVPIQIQLYIVLNGNEGLQDVTPHDFALGILNLNAGPAGSYEIASAANNLNYLVFNSNNSNAAQINVVDNDAGNDVISCGVNILTVLDVTGRKLTISGPIIGGQLIVDSSNLILSGNNSNSSTVLKSGTLNAADLRNLGSANGTIDFKGGTLNQLVAWWLPNRWP